MTASVIIASRNRASSLARALEQVGAEAKRLGARIIVVDNGSTDETPQVLKRLSLSLPLTVILETTPGKSGALNRALEMADTDFLLFTDDDMTFAPDWIEQLTGAAERWPEHGIFCGPILLDLPGELPEHVRGHEFLRTAYCLLEAPAEEGPIAGNPYGGNFAVRRSVVGGERFHHQFGAGRNDPTGEDTHFLIRMRSRGGAAVCVPGAWVRHRIEPHQFEESWLFERSFRAGREWALLQRDSSSVRLSGVPRHLWRRLVEAKVALWRQAVLGSRSARFDAELRVHHIRGQIFQYRLEHAAGGANRHDEASGTEM
jgi:glycosyltransferase involved in cell wall biosynthesis